MKDKIIEFLIWILAYATVILVGVMPMLMSLAMFTAHFVEFVEKEPLRFTDFIILGFSTFAYYLLFNFGLRACKSFDKIVLKGKKS